MSRAFVRDDDGGEGNEELPDRLISPHPNLVTPQGLAALDRAVAEFSAAYADAQSAGDRIALQRVARDLRYWTARRASADVQPQPSADLPRIAFGHTVTIARADGRRQTFGIVGEDEAEPARGTLSYVAPLAQALLGKGIGDTVKAGATDAEIVAIGV